MSRMNLLCLLFTALLLTGCSASKRTYSVSVRNETTQPITVWLCKDGPPIEDNWRSPEQVALEPIENDENLQEADVVPVGKQADTGPVTGVFESSTKAILRIYIGQLKFSEILGINKTSIRRKDVTLWPGHNELIVDNPAGELRVRRVQETRQ